MYSHRCGRVERLHRTSDHTGFGQAAKKRTRISAHLCVSNVQLPTHVQLRALLTGPHTHIYTQTHTHTRARTRTHTHTHPHTSAHTKTHKHEHSHKHRRTRAFARTRRTTYAAHSLTHTCTNVTSDVLHRGPPPHHYCPVTRHIPPTCPPARLPAQAARW